MNSDSVIFRTRRIMYSLEMTYRQFKTDKTLEIIMWTTPAATEMRFGFEVTMYVMNK